MLLSKKDRDALPAGVGKRSALAQRPAGLDAYRALGETYVRYRADDIDAATERLGAVDERLAVPRLPEEKQRALRTLVFNGQESIVRGFVSGLRHAPQVSAATGVQPDALQGLLAEREELWRIQLGAARIKTRTLDALLLTDSFGADLIARMVEWLDEELHRPDLTVADRERLLVNWGPFLNLLNQEQSFQKARRDRQDATSARVERDADAAEAEVRALRAGKVAHDRTLSDEGELGGARDGYRHLDAPAASGAPRRGRRGSRR